MSIIIETQNLTKKFGDFIANNDINLQVEKQEIKCIVGENGAGKSTLMNMLYGVLKPTSGKILLNGEELVMNSPTDAIRHGIGMVHQHFKLVPSLSVYENILLGSEITRRGLIDRRQEIEKVKQLIEEYHFQIDSGFRKQLELKKFKLFFLCIMHKEEGEENDKPRVVQSKQKEIM